MKKINTYELFNYYRSRKIRNTLIFILGFGLGMFACLFMIANCSGL